MNLKDFLNTVPELSHTEALEAAKNYSVDTGQLLDATTVNGALTDFKLITVLKDVSDDATHPARDICLGVYTGLLGNHPFNLMQNSFTGQRALTQLNWLIETGLPELATELSQFRDFMLWRASSVSYPFANVTLHDVLIIRNACPTKPLEAINGYVTITTKINTLSHAVRIQGVNPRTNASEILGHIRIDTARAYEFKIPTHHLNHTNLSVDDPYGVI